MNNGFAIPPLPRTNYGADVRDRSPYGHEPAFFRRSYEEAEAERTRKERHQTNVRHAFIGKEVPRVPWDVFVRDHLNWLPGEHFAMIGPTGQGKTTMLLNVLPLHPFVTVFATKPRDESMDRLVNEGYVKLDRWRQLDARIFPRRILWPDATSVDAENKQKLIFRDAFARIYKEGGWTVAIDELWYVINVLSLSREVRVFLLQARALGISLLCATQRPAYIPLEVYDQSTHLMFWRDNDETNLKRISGLASNSAGLIRETVANLDRFQVLYLNTRTGKMLRTRCPLVN